jgi:5-methyltetrahydrofolate--homocysteine methyltransferase
MTLTKISEHLASGDAVATSELIERAFAENYTAEMIVRQGLIAGFQSAEKKLKKHEILIPEIRMAVRALNRGLKKVQTAVLASKNRTLGTVILGTVEGEHEDIQKNLLSVMMQCLELKVVDLGTGVHYSLFLESAVKEKAGVICINAVHGIDLSPMKELLQAALSRGLKKKLKIILLGETVTEAYCRSIGADFYAPDVVSAAEYAANHYRRNRQQ